MGVGTARRVRWTEADCLAYEEASLEKHEFLDGEVFAMVAGKPGHNRLGARALRLLGNLLEGTGCDSFNSGQRIYIPSTGLYTYPDGGAACGEWRIHRDGMCLLNPVLLFEVLSPSTRDYDGGAKREHYEHIPSLRHLLLFDCPDRRVLHYTRAGENEPWLHREIVDGVISFPEWNRVIPLADLYREA